MPNDLPYYPIQLTASEQNWRLFAVRKHDPRFQKIAEKVYVRDEHRCQYCGFQAQSYMEILNLDGNYNNNKFDNFVTSCPFCAQCHFLEAVGQSDFGGGTLIYLPDLSQNELNSLCHAAFLALANGLSYLGNARNLYRSLRLSQQEIEKEFGEGMSNPALFGRLLVEAQGKDLTALQTALKEKVRLLPSISKYREQVLAWSVSALEHGNG